jgi:aryl-alcohol dehydrogenase-like predicted oxidoreductase
MSILQNLLKNDVQQLLSPSTSLGLGCMSLTDHTPLNKRLFKKAFDQGIRFFDTADIYQDGINEALLGDALKEHRKDLQIATKVGHIRLAGGALSWAPSKKHILSAVDQSLKRLQTDYIDLYQLHGGTIDDPFEEIVEAFELLKQQGKILAYGISSIRPNVIRQYVAQSNISTVMMQYNLLDRRPEEEVSELLSANGIGMIARGAVANGLLMGTKLSDSYLSYTSSEVTRAQKSIQLVAERLGLSPLAVALSYIISNPALRMVALGIRTEAQLDQAIHARQQLSILQDEDLQQLRFGLRDIYYDQHR